MRIDKIPFFGREIYVLRDDLLGEFNGNKARKLKYFLDMDLTNIKKVVSYGSSQSNAMQSISVFAKLKKIHFQYVCNHISKNLLNNPIGNFKSALDNGMEIFINEDRINFAKKLVDENTLFIKEGVAQKEAKYGFLSQANDIKEYANKNNLKFDIFLPSGTGTSATYLKEFIDFDVYTTPCVGDEDYLKKQILELSTHFKVKIIKSIKKYHFAKLYPELFEIWQSVKQSSGIEFDLIYDPVGLKALKENIDIFKNDILYIHQGGILGNISQLERYKHKLKHTFV